MLLRVERWRQGHRPVNATDWRYELFTVKQPCPVMRWLQLSRERAAVIVCNCTAWSICAVFYEPVCSGSAAAHMLHCCNCKRSVVFWHKTANLLLIKTTRRVYRASGRVKLIHHTDSHYYKPPKNRPETQQENSASLTDHQSINQSISAFTSLGLGSVICQSEVWLILYLQLK